MAGEAWGSPTEHLGVEGRTRTNGAVLNLLTGGQ